MSGSAAKFALSLRIWHPDRDLSDFGERFGRRPDTVWTVGAARTSPSGEPLPGRHETSYWTAQLAEGDLDGLVPALASLTETLAEQGSELDDIVQTGGRVEYLVGWFADANAAAVIPYDLAEDMGRLGISLALDVYGAPPPTRAGRQ
jgi:hypothetical protein